MSLFLCVIPKHSVNVPPLSLGFLQGACEKHGVDVEIRDFNFDLWQKTIHTDKWNSIWLETNQTLFKGKEFENFCADFYDDEIKSWANEIVQTNHKHIGISCFSHRSLPTFKKLATEIRKLDPTKLIIAGGAPMTQYGKWIFDSGLADFVVISEGEEVLPDIVKGKYSPGIISNQQIDDLDNIAFPRYNSIHRRISCWRSSKKQKLQKKK
jgi:hypothetical protein